MITDMTKEEAADWLWTARWALEDVGADIVLVGEAEDLRWRVRSVTATNLEEFRTFAKELRWRTYKCAPINTPMTTLARLFFVEILNAIEV